MGSKQTTENPKKPDKDFWDDLPVNVKTGIEPGRKQVTEDKVTPHAEAMKKADKKPGTWSKDFEREMLKRSEEFAAGTVKLIRGRKRSRRELMG